MKIFFHLFFCLVFLSANGVLAKSAIEKYRLTPSRRFGGLLDSTIYPVSLNQPDAAFLKTNSKHLRRDCFIDFNKKEVELVSYYGDALDLGVIAYKDSVISGVVLSSCVFMELDDYLNYINQPQNDADFKAGNPFFSMTEKTRKSFNPLDIEIPVKLPAWARRVVGSEGPRLTINGMFKISVGGTSHWVEGAQDIENQKQGFPDISVNQEMNFTVTGKIGRLINVSISTDNTQDVTDQLKKQMKIHYKGETEDELEDEIIQEIEAGYTNFSMPGSEFDGYSESHEGLFGIKVRMKLGDLEVTTIASQEDGQADKKTFNASQQTTVTENEDKMIASNRIFFLDTNYYTDYYKNPNRSTLAQITKVYLLKSDNVTQDMYKVNKPNYPDHRLVGDGVYKLLKEVGTVSAFEADYYVDRNRGFVALKQAMGREDRLLAYFEDATGKKSSDADSLRFRFKDSVNGDFFVANLDTVYPYLLKPETPRTTDWRWRLAWKNVYNLGEISEQNRSSLKLEMMMKDSIKGDFSVATFMENGKERRLSDYFELTKEDGSPNIKNTQIFMFDQGLLVLPAKFGPEPFNSDILAPGLIKNPGIYTNKTDEANSTITSQYQIRITAVAAKTTFSLGVINIMQGTEVVRIGSSLKLERDIDYQIDYEIGQITLISDRALNSMSNISVEYEYAPFFIPEEKTFVGVRAEYKLPNIGKGSTVSASFLRKSETSQDKRSQLGREPSSNMLVDVTTKLAWEPEWMTDLVNKIPGVKTEAKSNLSIQAEYARSIVNPNTSEKREALIDDFEDSKVLYTLQLSDAVWRWASPPVDSVIGWDSTYGSFSGFQCWGGHGRGEGILRDVGWFAWYMHDTTENAIWPGASNAQSRWPTLELNMNPHQRKASGATDNTWLKKASWGGIMTSLGTGVKSQLENAQYLEIWLRVNSRSAENQGMLHIDLGEISEDLRLAPQNSSDTGITSIMIVNSVPDRNFETEWFIPDKYYMTKETDMGLDGRDDPYEKMLVPKALGAFGSFSFDTLSYDGVTITDPAGDNYDWVVTSTDFRGYNGTQWNSTGTNFDSRKQNSPDNEDVFNSNGNADRRNAYRHFWIDLNAKENTKEPYFAGATSTGWRLYRIPLLQRKVTGDARLDRIPYLIGGSPLLTEAKGIRIWYDSLVDASRLQIAKIEIVGNKWLSRDTVKVDSQAARMDVSVVNTVDNRDIYTHPSFVPKFYDSDQGVDVREQSLDLKYDAVSLAHPEVKAEKFYQTPQDFRLYKRMLLYFKPLEMFKNGISDHTGNVSFFLRFGMNDSSYYEYRVAPQSISDWQSFDIDLNYLASLKQEDIRKNGAVQKRPDVKVGSYSVKGYPTFARINWLALGFQLDSNSASGGGDVYSGRYFVDDLKLIQPQDLGGNAARIKLTTDFADLLSVSTGMYYKDGSFLRLTDKWAGASATEVSMDVNTSLALHKFTPARWGLSIPLTASIQSSIQRPLYVPESDYRLQQDGLTQVMPDLFSLMAGNKPVNKYDENVDTGSVGYETTHLSRAISTSFKKNTTSENLLVDLTVDRIQTGIGYSQSDDKNTSRATISENINNNLTYNASARKEMAIQPFQKSERALLKDNLSELKIYYYPKSVDFKIYDARYSESQEYSRTQLRTSQNPLPRFSLSMGQSYDINYSPVIEWKYLTFGLSHSNSVERNFTDIVSDHNGLSDDLLGYFFGYDTNFVLSNKSHFILYGETGNTQSFSYDLTPAFFKWLTHSFNYRSNYGHNVNSQNLQQGGVVNYLDVTSGTAFSSNVSWMFLDMMDWAVGLYKKDGSSANNVVKDFFNYIGLNRIGFNYDLSANRKISNLKMMPLTPLRFLAFKAGLLGFNPINLFTGDDNAREFGGWKYNNPSAFVQERGVSSTDGRNVTMNASTNMGINLPFLLKTSLNSSLKYSKTFNEVQGHISVDTSIVWPSYTITATVSDFMELVKYVPLLGPAANSSSFSSGFNFEKGSDIRFDPFIIATKKRWEELRFKYALSPLARVGVDLKNKIRMDNNTEWSLERRYSTANPSTTKGLEEYRVSNKTSLGYTVDKHKTIKLLFWDLTLNNQLQLSASYDYSMNWSYQWDMYPKGQLVTSVSEYETAGGSLQHSKKDKSYTWGASGSYDITAKMKAGANFSYKKTLDVKPGLKDDDPDNRPDKTISVDTWVQWNF